MAEAHKLLVEMVRASGHFDESWYLERYPDVVTLGMDAVEHYLWLGERLGRDPSAQFSSRGYLATHPDVADAKMNPLVHYALQGRSESRQIRPANEFSVWASPRAEFIERRSFDPPANRPVRVVALYLPQFHAIAENDSWWGKGFTEWSNVRPAQPQFIGHYQPHVPHDDIGYYDLSSTAMQHRQVELARAYGIEGFCFYYYWFGGKRLLEKPIENYLGDRSLNFPFCLCWANENWSRRWDGLDSEILMAQAHSPEDDLRIIEDLARFVRDERYIRIDGKPLVVIYRPSLLPSPRKTAQRWRDWCRVSGIGEIYLAYTQSFENADPTDYGFDAAIEFPPNNSAPPDLTDRVVPTHTDYAGKVYDWRILVERSNHYRDPGYKLFRSVCPGWDNTARRRTGGTAFVGNTPQMYQQWLENAVADALRRFKNPDERLVFVNAWNEWAEGAHLEPDKATGYAYLEATRAALKVSHQQKRRIVIVSHDAYRHGAQYLALYLVRCLTTQFNYAVDLIVLGDGPLKDEYAKWAVVHDLAGLDPNGSEVALLVNRINKQGATCAICNTSVSGAIIPALKAASFRVISLIHELPGVITQYRLEDTVQSIAQQADRIVFAAKEIEHGFVRFASIEAGKSVIRPQGVYKSNSLARQNGGIAMARARLRERFNLPHDTPIVLTVGYADWRKGFDLFIEAAIKLLENEPRTRFIWLGLPSDPAWMALAKAAAVKAGIMDCILMPGQDEATDMFYAGADVYSLPSREDPYPSVVLEAMECGLPVVAFSGTGGMEELIGQAGGVLVRQFDTSAFAAGLVHAMRDPTLRQRALEAGPKMIAQQYCFRQYVHDLLVLGNENVPRISVVVPNYNYGHYIEERLRSVCQQSLPIYELIVLDDKSTDDSVIKIETFLADCAVPTQLVINEDNSGSVFRQWLRGVTIARGEYVWIAEADDLADEDFLDQVVPAFDDPNVMMSYCQSRQIDSDGHVTAHDYLPYLAEIDRERWTRSYIVRGSEEIKKALFLKNTIPNVSACVFRTKELLATLKAHEQQITSCRNVGDWLVYLRLLEQGSIAFSPRSANSHRRHQSSVTIGNSNRRHLDEIVSIHAEVITRHNLGPDATRRAEAYAKQIASQFGLSSE